MRDTTAEMRGIWIDLLSLASDGYYGDEGIVKLSEGSGLTDKQIARILSLSLEQWCAAKGFFEQGDMIEVTKDNSIIIRNWAKYQSSYDRQKPYRGKGKAADSNDPDKYIKGKFGHMVRR